MDQWSAGPLIVKLRILNGIVSKIILTKKDKTPEKNNSQFKIK